MSMRTAGFVWAALLWALEPAAVYCEDFIEKLQTAENAGQLDQAQHWARLIIKREELNDPNGSLRPMALEHLASLLQDQARFAEAEQFYQESIRLWELRPDAPSLGLANAINGLGSLYDVTGRLESAETFCRRALSIRIKRLGRNNTDVAVSYSNLGVVLLRQKQFQQAETAAQQALSIWDHLHSPQDRSAVDLNTLALVRRQERDFESAIAYDQAAIEKCRQSPPSDHWSLVSYIHTLAVIYWDVGNGSRSLEAFREALAVWETNSFPNALEKRNLMMDYARVLRGTGQNKKAKTMERQAQAENAKILKMNPAQQYTVDVNSLRPGAPMRLSGPSFIQ